MIEHVIRLPLNSPLANSDPVLEWLQGTLGPRAPFLDCVDTARPWAVVYHFGEIELAFARATDAVMFKLKWGV
jgi:hypothetical protein